MIQEIQTNRGIRIFFDPLADSTERASRCAHYFAEQVDALSPPAAEPVTAVVSGMAGSSLGWKELPYAQIPFALDGSTAAVDSFALQTPSGVPVAVCLVSGVQTEVEIMRGEEVEMMGLFANGRHADVARDGVLIMPGTHSKHVQLRGNRMVDFRTFMTGELFDLLGSHSVLRASIAASAADATGDSLRDRSMRQAFVDGVIMVRDRGLSASLFQVRTRTVLQNVSPMANRWFLSGLLVGAEVSASRTKQVGDRTLVAAVPPLSDCYLLALQTIAPEAAVEVATPEEMRQASIRGHAALLRTWSPSDPSEPG